MSFTRAETPLYLEHWNYETMSPIITFDFKFVLCELQKNKVSDTFMEHHTHFFFFTKDEPAL